MAEKTLTYNKKLVIKWKKEHRVLLTHAKEIISIFKENKDTLLKEELENFYTLATEHLVSEDLEFFKLSMLEDSLDQELTINIEDFIETFEETKYALMQFLTKYTLPNAVYDKEFIKTFQKLATALKDRMSYEERNLYKVLESK